MMNEDRSIALCLSGGGFRATLFHFGVIKALRHHLLDGEMALKQVGEIYSVSGGSIVAAHLLRNYDRYIGSDEEFAAVEKEIVAFANRDVRNRVLRRAGFVFQGSRGYWLKKEYARLLGGSTIGECYRAAKDAPTVHILATDFRTGELCSFTRTNFEKLRRVRHGIEVDVAPAGQIDLAFAVAASSSFPPMFPPIPLTPRMLGSPQHSEFVSPILLSDGGVYDNFGIDLFRLVKREGHRPTCVLVSHAGGSFDTAPSKTYSGVLARNIRASDILMRRVGEITLEAGQNLYGNGYGLIRIGATEDDGTLEVSTQQLLRLVRTDLDAFDRDISRLLIDHGKRIAGRVFADRGWTPPPFIPGTHDTSRDRRLARAAESAGQRSYTPLFFDFRDWAVLAVWWILLLGAAYIAVSTSLEAHEASKVEERERAALVQKANRLSDLLEPVREAAQRGDLTAVKQALATTINAVEGIAANPSQSIPPTSDIVPSEELKRVVSNPPPLAKLEVTNRPQRVFIQFAGNYTRAQITSLNAALKQAGWLTQGASGERIPGVKINEVRYSGDNRAAAQELADAANSTGLPGSTVTPRPNPKIGSNNLELWMSN
jgi:predicted acylesterase/phospholipase RssA